MLGKLAIWGAYSRAGMLAAILAYAADRVHKWWMLDVYRIGERGPVELAPFLDLKFVLNRGISYGLLAQNSTAGQAILTAVAIAASIMLALWMARAHSRLMAISLGLIIGGALGNATDRVLFGGVADFFYFHPFQTRLLIFDYVFNVADVAITAGVAVLAAGILFLNPEPAERREP
jgi:signal peptidase II